MTTNANIAVQSKDNAIMLPIEAVQGSGSTRFVSVDTVGTASSISNTSNKHSYSGGGTQGSSGGGGYTTSIGSGEVARKEVQVGISNQNYIQITSGVNEGDTVLVKIVKSTTSTTKSTAYPQGGSGGYGGGNRGGQ